MAADDDTWMRTDATPSTVTPLERGLAAYVASTVHGATRITDALRRALVRLDTPEWLLDNIRAGAGWWSVSDDDRVDAIVGYAAQLAGEPEQIETADLDRLRAVGLTGFDILDLNYAVSSCRDVDRIGDREP